ncbi:MAG: hypothetical protein K8I00_12325 [Candidatus Omnitrophica bacterium]|nr:hypothetical protein [Candidatus Omnitrophota bacterium]
MRIQTQKAQTAIEYLLLLATVVAIVLLALPSYIPRVSNAANVYFYGAANAMLDIGPRCGDGTCDSTHVPPFETPERCCDDCGGC